MSKKFIEVYLANNTADLIFLKSMFDENGITYFVDGENFSQLHGGMIPIKVRVHESQVEEAKKLIQELES